jgi:hypothetical protein
MLEYGLCEAILCEGSVMYLDGPDEVVQNEIIIIHIYISTGQLPCSRVAPTEINYIIILTHDSRTFAQ